MTRTFGRRDFTRRLATVGGGLVLAAALPEIVTATSLGHGGGCPMPFGPLHQYLYNTGPAPDWQHAVILRESGWDVGATNPSSGAAGLCQFLWGTWEDAQRRSGIYGSPYNGYDAITMMNWLLRNGEYFHWSCNGEAGCYDV